MKQLLLMTMFLFVAPAVFVTSHSSASEENKIVTDNLFTTNRAIDFGDNSTFNEKLREYLDKMTGDDLIFNAGCGGCYFSAELLLDKNRKILPYVVGITPYVPKKNACLELKNNSHFKLIKKYFHNVEDQDLLKLKNGKEIKNVSMIVDSVGVGSYSDSITTVLERYLSLLKKGGKIFMKSMNSHRIVMSNHPSEITVGYGTFYDAESTGNFEYDEELNKNNELVKFYKNTLSVMEFVKKYSRGISVNIVHERSFRPSVYSKEEIENYNASSFEEPRIEVIITKVSDVTHIPKVKQIPFELMLDNESESLSSKHTRDTFNSWIKVYKFKYTNQLNGPWWLISSWLPFPAEPVVNYGTMEQFWILD